MTTALEVVEQGEYSPMMDLASAVSERVNIEDVRLAEMTAKRGLISDRLPSTLQFAVNTTTQVDEKNLLILVQVKSRLVGKYEDSETAPEALQLEAVFHLMYRIASLKDLTKANFDAFGQLNGLYNAWPYWREFVQSMTVRMGLPSLTIPVLKPAPRKVAGVTDQAAAERPTKPRRSAKGK